MTVQAPTPGPWLFPGRSRGSELILRPWNEIYRRNGSLKYDEPWGFGTNGPGYSENISNLVCTPSFGYETPVRGYSNRAVTPTHTVAD